MAAVTNNVNKKASDVGWYSGYDAPAPANDAHSHRVGVVKSQIPESPACLNIAKMPPHAVQKRERLETEYIKLAKGGGQQDLLNHDKQAVLSEAPQAYPRVNWFYLEDNKQEIEKEQLKSESSYGGMPDYMVYTDPPPAQDYQPDRSAFEYDTQSAFDRDQRPSDKTVRLNNDHPEGYGIRAQKQDQPKPTRHSVPAPARGKAPQPEYSTTRKTEPCQLKDDPQPDMSKIMSMDYGREWEGERQKWQSTHKTETTGPRW